MSVLSEQQRTPNVAPRRQLSAPQHVASVVQVAASGEHVHMVDVPSQFAHVPVVGPRMLPLTHSPVVAQYPQPPPGASVQSRHVAKSEQASTVGQLSEIQLHVLQVPLVGPAELPALHVPVPAHQPQLDAPVHDAQSVWLAQSSGAAHSDESHAHAPLQVVPVGPLALPERHAPSQKPQPARAVHVSHVVASAHGSVGPVHSEVCHAQLPHEPVLGPVESPTPQVPVSPHQPQG